MIPLHSNPYLLPQTLSLELTSRRNAFGSDLNSNSDHETQLGSENIEQDRLQLVNVLKARIQASLEVVKEAHELERQRRNHSLSQPTSTEPIVFKLFSGAIKPIALEPGPPRVPPHYREPDYEDDELEAKRRKTLAESVAVDYSWLLRESQKPYLPFPSARDKLLHASISGLANNPPPMMILRRERARTLRKTREPVSEGEPTLSQGTQPSSKEQLPLVDITLQSPGVSDKRKRRRKRRKIIR